MGLLESLQGLISGVLRRVPVFFAARIAWPLGRSIGYISNRLDPGRPGLVEAISNRDWFRIAERVGQSVPFSPYGPLGLGVDFWRGAAYENTSELAEGWLSTTTELFVPATDIRRMVEGTLRLDPDLVLDGISDMTADRIGVSSVAAYFRGLTNAVNSLTGGQFKVERIAGDVSGFFVWFNNLLDAFPDGRAGPQAEEWARRGRDIIEGARPGAKPDKRSDFERARDEALRSMRRISGDPTTRRLIQALKEDAKDRKLTQKLINIIKGL